VKLAFSLSTDRRYHGSANRIVDFREDFANHIISLFPLALRETGVLHPGGSRVGWALAL